MPHPMVLQLRFTRREFARAVKGVSEAEGLQRPHGLNAIGWSVAHLTWQEQKYFLDYGQVVAVRRLLGHEKVPHFVGNLDSQASYQAEPNGHLGQRPASREA